MTTTVEWLNGVDRETFTARLHHIFEASPWIAERAAAQRPFADRDALLAALVGTMRSGTRDEQLALIRAHPELAGSAARSGVLDHLSRGEQAAAQLERLASADAARFDERNAAYRERFGFPFVICVRENTKESILRAFDERMANEPDREIDVALAEIEKIARLRFEETVHE